MEGRRRQWKTNEGWSVARKSAVGRGWNRIPAIAECGRAWLVAPEVEEDVLPSRHDSPATAQTPPKPSTKKESDVPGEETAVDDPPRSHHARTTPSSSQPPHNPRLPDVQAELTENLSPPSSGSSFQPLGSIGDVLGFDRWTRSQCHGKRMETKSGSFFSAFGKVVGRAASHVSPRTRHASEACPPSPAMVEHRPFLPHQHLRAPDDREGASWSPTTPPVRRRDPSRKKKLPGLPSDARGRTWRRSAPARGHGRAATVAYAAFGRAERGKRDRRSARMERIQKRRWKQHSGNASDENPAKTSAASQGC